MTLDARRELGIGEIVGLLNDVAPARVAELSREFPEEQASLRPGQMLGPTALPGRWRFLLRVALSGLDEATSLADRCFALAHLRLRRALQLEFIATTVALVASASTVVLVAAHADATKTVVSAIGACIGNLLLAGVTMQRNGLGGKDSVSAVHARLAALLPELTFLKGRLASYRSETEFDARMEQELGDLVARAEQLCKEVRVRCADVPGSVLLPAGSR